jgi:hypothetical protein
LLGEVNSGVRRQSVDDQAALNGSDSREGPATSARRLVLDGGDITSGNPVDVSSGDFGFLDDAGVALRLDLQGEVGGGELLLG